MSDVLERDLSLEEAARVLGHSPRHLRAVWSEIPTAYIAGRRYWVNPTGLRQWLYERSNTGDAAADAGKASAAFGR